MSKLTISYSNWKQYDKYHYEIREGNNPLIGKILFSGKDFSTKKEALNKMNAQIRKIVRN